MQQKNECPYCKGSLFIGTGYKEKVESGKRVLYPYALPCYCEVNKQISVRFPILSTLPDVTPKDAALVFKKYKFGNFLFFGDEDKFRYLAKAYFVNKWNSKDYMILEGMGVVQNYHVPKKDGTWLTIDTLNQYDLLVLLFTSYTHYDTLKNCILDVIKNRQRLGKPTWVYAKSDDTLNNSKEYSEDLLLYFEKFSKVKVERNFNYEGYVEGDSAKKLHKQQLKLNDSLGNSL